MRLSLVLFAALVSTATVADDQGADLLARLADPIARCVARRDTGHDLFRGCIDWHSAVHGAWALAQVQAATGNGRYRGLVDQNLDRTLLARELAFLREQDRLGGRFEMPYGRAWFLRFALTDPYRGDDAVKALASYCAETLMSFARQDGGRISADDYDNASWYLLNLWQWYEAQRDQRALDELRKIILRRYGPVTPESFREFHRLNGFFAPKELALLLLLKVLPDGKVTQRLVASLGSDDLSPAHPPFRLAHHGGLNFSRAWGLQAAWEATGDPRLCSAYRAHLRERFQGLQDWARDYNRYGHWVGQFGVYAIMLEQASPRKCGLDNLKSGEGLIR